MFLAKCRESAYVDSEYVTEAFCSLLRRDIKDVYKSKGNTLVNVLAANLLLSAFRNEKTWPDIFVRVSLPFNSIQFIFTIPDACTTTISQFMKYSYVRESS